MHTFDPIKPADHGYHRQIYIHRKGFYALFKKYSLKEYEFDGFMNATAIRMKQSYSIIGYLIHGYITYWSLSRVFYCPVFEFPCTLRQWTLVDASQWIQLGYYLLCWIPIPKVQQITYYYGSLMMNGTLFFTFSLTREYPWMLSGGINGRFKALIVPVFYYIVFLLTCTRVRLASWIMNSYRNRKSESKLHLIQKHLWKPFFLLLPMTSLVVYTLFANTKNPPDFIYPHWIQLIILDAIISFISFSWINFLIFQIQFVVFEEYWEKGVVLMKYGPDITIGVLY